MKVLAVNGSPRGLNGCTRRMLEPLLEGMRAEGAETEMVYLVEKHIHHCLGCFACWLKTPGKCVIQDDMTGLIEKLVQADLVVFGTPLYILSMTGLMKNFLDRLLPIFEPWLITSEDGTAPTFHPMRYKNPKKMLLVSPCGFPEFEHFDALVATFKKCSAASKVEYIGEILRPGAELLVFNNFFLKMKLKFYYADLKKAGRELILHGAISEKTQQALRKDLIPGDVNAFRKKANAFFKKKIEQGK